MTAALGPHRVDDLRKRPEVSLDSFTGLSLAFLSVNNERPYLSDTRVRQALSRALDRHTLVTRFFGGHGEPARGPLPPSLLGRPGPIRHLLLDRPGAERLLGEAGLPKGLDTTLLTVDSPRPYMPAPILLGQELRDQLGAAGIRAAVTVVPTWSEYLARVTRGDYDLALLGWQADTTDPNDFLSALLGSEAIGTTNRSRYRDAHDGRPCSSARGRESDLRAREAVYREAQELFQQDMPFVPLYHVSVFTAYRRAVRGMAPGPTGLLRYDKTWKTER